MAKREIMPLCYLGKRLSNDGTKLFHKFIDEEGEILSFGGRFSMVWIGYWYESDKEGENHTIKHSPKLIDKDQHKDSDKWQIESEADVLRHSENTQRKSLNKVDISKLNLKELIIMASKLNGYDKKQRFAELIAHKIIKEGEKLRKNPSKK